MSGSRSPLNLEKELEAVLSQTPPPHGPRTTRGAGTPVRDLLTGNPWGKMKVARTGPGPASPSTPLLEDSRYQRMEDGGEEDEEEMIPSPYVRPHLGEVREDGNSQEEQVTMLGIAALLRQELTHATASALEELHLGSAFWTPA